MRRTIRTYSIPDDLDKRYETWVKRNSYNRSEHIRSLIRKHLEANNE